MSETQRLVSLQTAHDQLKSELKSLRRRGRLTPSEQEAARLLKKAKLHTKDRIRILVGQAGD
jgi:uncharacterized protein YdcH (DUF465 family)